MVADDNEQGNINEETHNRDEEVARLQAIIIDDNDFLDKIVELNSNDFAFIGQFIQLYCVADLNARRIISSARYVKTGIPDDVADKLTDKDVIELLSKSAEILSLVPHLGDGISRAAQTLELHRIHRHHFAHWVVKRMPGEEAFIFMSKSSTDAKKRTGVVHQPKELTWGVIQIKDIAAEAEKLSGHGEYLARIAAETERHIEHLRSNYVAQQKD